MTSYVALTVSLCGGSGPVTVTGVMEEQNGTSIQIGIPTSGRIPDGATVERQVDNSFDKSDHLILTSIATISPRPQPSPTRLMRSLVKALPLRWTVSRCGRAPLASRNG